MVFLFYTMLGIAFFPYSFFSVQFFYAFELADNTFIDLVALRTVRHVIQQDEECPRLVYRRLLQKIVVFLHSLTA